MTIYYDIEQSPLFQETNLLDDWALDYSIFSLKHRAFTNRQALWQRFIRS